MLNGIKRNIGSIGKKFKYRKTCTFAYGSRLFGDVILKGRNFVGQYAVIRDCEMGFASYAAARANLNKTKVGNYTCIGPNVDIVFGNHPTSKFVSLHPSFYSLHRQVGFTYAKEQLFDEDSFSDYQKRWHVEIGNDVWIGDGARIMAGITIGDGAVIAAGAVVTKNVDPYTIVGGIPAKPIRKRFSEEQIQYLLKVKWWEKDQAELEQMAESFSDIEVFMAKHGPI